MKTTCIYIALLFLTTKTLSQPEVKSMAEPGNDAIFIYLGRGIVSTAHPYQQITAYKVERKEANKNNWITLGEFKAPSSEDDFRKKFNAALPYFPQPNKDNPVPLEQLWQRATRFATADSIAPFNFYLPVMIALGYAAVDKDIKPGGTYQYRISHQISGSWKAAFVTNTVSFPYRQEMPKPHSTRSFTEKKSIDITFAMPKKKLPSYFQVMRRDHFSGAFRTVTAPRFLSTRNDSLYILVHDTSLTAHQGYEYFLATYNRAGNAGPNSDTVTLASYNFNEVYLPHHIHTRNQRGMPGLLVSWRMDNTDLCKGLRLYRSTDHDKNFEPIADVLPTDTLYVDQDVVPMTRYYYHFRILGVLGESSVTSATAFGLYQEQQAPMPPLYPEAATDAKGVRLTWSAGDDHIKGYYVYRGNENALELISPLISDTTYLDDSPALSGKTVYHYALKAENTSHAISNFSDTVQARPGTPVYTQRPREMTAQIIDGAVHLAWLEMREYDNTIYGYEVARSVDGKKYTTIRQALEENNMVDTTATPGPTYTYRVRSLNAFGSGSDWSSDATADIPVTVTELPPPAGLQAYKGANTITLRWGGILQEGITGYKLYKHTTGGQPVLLTSVNNSTYEYTDKSVRHGERYFYSITCTTAGNESPQSKPVIISY